MASRRAGVQGLILLSILVVIVFSILISLGNWQLRRLVWKETLIADATTRPGLPPIQMPATVQWPQFDIDAALYRRVGIEGRFDHARQAWVFTHLPDATGNYRGPGYWIVTPFNLTSGGTVWINRGFAPDGRHELANRDEVPGDQTMTVTGLIRPDEPRTSFTPTDAPQKNMFFTRNIAILSAAKSVEGPVAPFTIDLLANHTPRSGLPQAGETRSVFANSHLQYALTWYGLAGALFAVFSVFTWRRLRGSA